jgi:hypothetical protein
MISTCSTGEIQASERHPGERRRVGSRRPYRGDVAKGVVKPKKPCCQSRPRCKRCPVVLERLERAGLARRKKKGFKVSADVPKRDLKAARRR